MAGVGAGNVREECRWGQPGVLSEGWSQEAWEALDSQWTATTPTPKPLQPEAAPSSWPQTLVSKTKNELASRGEGQQIGLSSIPESFVLPLSAFGGIEARQAL